MTAKTPTGAPGRRPSRGPVARLWRKTVWLFKLLIVLLLFAVTLLFNNIVHDVLPGQRGVLWSRFGGGTQMDRSYGEGILLTWPWDKVYVYDLREQATRLQTIVYAQDGLEITVNISVRFRLAIPELPLLHREIGPEFQEKVIGPETISTLRKVLGNYTPEMIYAKDEFGLLDELRRTLEADLDPRFFHVVSLLVLDLRLPAAVEDAIKLKLAEEQNMLSYRFRLEREEDEKVRRITEAEGIQEFEAISGVSILKWRGIEATERLATSQNAKIVMMGSGEGQLPVILNADVAGPAAAPAPEPPAPLMDATQAPAVGAAAGGSP